MGEGEREMLNLLNRRTRWLTTANIVVLVIAFKWIYPEASIADIPLVIAFTAWVAATVMDVLLGKCFRSKTPPDHVNQN